MNQFQIVKEKILIKFESPMHKSIFIYSWFVVEILKKSRKLASLVILVIFFMTYKGQQSLESLWLRVVTIQAISTCNF